MLRARMLQPAVPAGACDRGGQLDRRRRRQDADAARAAGTPPGARGLRAGVVSRGYRREGDGIELRPGLRPGESAGDEPLLVQPSGRVPVAVGRDRVRRPGPAGGPPEIQLIVSDDGLQHLPGHATLSVLVFDERGVGNGRLLPAGPLRQAPRWTPCCGRDRGLQRRAAKRAALATWVGRRLRGAVRLQDWWAGRPAEAASLAALRQGTWTAVAGVARPQRFFDMLSDLGLHLRACRSPTMPATPSCPGQPVPSRAADREGCGEDPPRARGRPARLGRCR